MKIILFEDIDVWSPFFVFTKKTGGHGNR